MLALIGGTGLNTLEGIGGFDLLHKEEIATPFADTQIQLSRFVYAGIELLFIPRHGDGHVVPPHRINYHGNIDALRLAGATRVVAMNAIGGIAPELCPGAIAIPEQLVDYSYGRISSFYEDNLEGVVHIDFGEPYNQELRQALLEAAARVNAGRQQPATVIDGGVYGCTQGPRLETNAEISRMRADGCTMVGMTGMPEAALAREAGIDYATIGLVVNWAAGLTQETITLDEIYAVIDTASPFLHALLRELIAPSSRAQ